jgi:DNA-binding transcriptional ArsR family regulator
MGVLQDLLKEVPLSSVLKERVALAEEKYDGAMKEIEGYKQKVTSLERENENLRAQIPKSDGTLSDDTARVLVHLFKAATQVDRDVGVMSRQLTLEQGVLKYHLDRLKEGGLADIVGGNYVHGHTYWALSPKGRQYVVERKLI